MSLFGEPEIISVRILLLIQQIIGVCEHVQIEVVYLKALLGDTTQKETAQKWFMVVSIIIVTRKGLYIGYVEALLANMQSSNLCKITPDEVPSTLCQLLYSV